MYELNEAHYMNANQAYDMVFHSHQLPPPHHFQWYKPNCWNNMELIFAHLLITFFLL